MIYLLPLAYLAYRDWKKQKVPVWAIILTVICALPLALQGIELGALVISILISILLTVWYGKWKYWKPADHVILLLSAFIMPYWVGLIFVVEVFLQLSRIRKNNAFLPSILIIHIVYWFFEEIICGLMQL